MAVWKLQVVSGEGWTAVKERVGEPEHVGLVIAVDSRLQRIMSDVYACVTFAVVWNAAEGAPNEVNLGNDEFGLDRAADVDATTEVLAAYDAFLRAREEDSRRWAEEAAEERAKGRVLTPTLGTTVKVVRGRKVPKGTEGAVIWTDTFRVGIKDAAGTTHWTSASNVERVVAPKAGETWRDLEQRLAAAAPRMWSRVEVVGGTEAPLGTTGMVFFLKGPRVGIATSNRKEHGRYADVVWSNLQDVKVIVHQDGPPPSVEVAAAKRPLPGVVPF